MESKAITESKATCFVVMPFGEKLDAENRPIDFDEIYEYLIKPAVEGLAINCIRSDEVTKAGWVHADMLERLLRDDVVIVDITTLNPNVFYELGVRHALRRSVTILIRKSGTAIPFNIRGFRVLEYGLSLKEAHEASRRLRAYIETGLGIRADDSLVYAVFPSLSVSAG